MDLRGWKIGHSTRAGHYRRERIALENLRPSSAQYRTNYKIINQKTGKIKRQFLNSFTLYLTILIPTSFLVLHWDSRAESSYSERMLCWKGQHELKYYILYNYIIGWCFLKKEHASNDLRISKQDFIQGKVQYFDSLALDRQVPLKGT